jgi:spermidine synthase
VDVAEIEPSLYEIGQKYFGVMPDERLRNHITDGRRLLHDAAAPYDLIFTDVYYAMAIPSHFATREYHELVRDQLTSGGVYMANLVGDFSPEPPNILYSQMRVIREVFPNSYFFAMISPDEPGTQSIVAYAINGEKELNLTSPEIADNPNPLIRGLPGRLVDESRIDWQRYAVMTNNYAPAEYFALSTLRRELAED